MRQHRKRTRCFCFNSESDFQPLPKPLEPEAFMTPRPMRCATNFHAKRGPHDFRHGVVGRFFVEDGPVQLLHREGEAVLNGHGNKQLALGFHDKFCSFDESVYFRVGQMFQDLKAAQEVNVLNPRNAADELEVTGRRHEGVKPGQTCIRPDSGKAIQKIASSAAEVENAPVLRQELRRSAHGEFQARAMCKPCERVGRVYRLFLIRHKHGIPLKPASRRDDSRNIGVTR